MDIKYIVQVTSENKDGEKSFEYIDSYNNIYKILNTDCINKGWDNAEEAYKYANHQQEINGGYDDGRKLKFIVCKMV